MSIWVKLKTNPALWKNYFIREKIIRTIRNFFYQNGFHEVETPLLVPKVIPESYLDVFETYLKDRKGKEYKMFLTTSPEASLKKLLVGGIGNCFEITKSFRNSEIGSSLHNPEFTILEWYRIGASYKDIMRDCEDLILFIYKNIADYITCFSQNNNQIKYQDIVIDLSPPWEKISVSEAFKKYVGVCLTDLIDKHSDFFSVEKISKIAKEKGYHVGKNHTWEQIFHQLFLNEIEPNLGTKGKPTIIYDYPKPLCALAKIKEDDPRFAERFEFYIGGLEIGDCYTELTDFQEYEKRFKKEISNILKTKNKTKVIQDDDFLKAVKNGLPSCSGIAVGIDRLVMLFTNAKSIDDVMLFPINKIVKV